MTKRPIFWLFFALGVLLWIPFALAESVIQERDYQTNISPGIAVTPHGQTRGVSTAQAPARLRGVLNAVRARYGDVTVISVCRPGAVIAGTGRRSRHADCMAIDFHVANRRAVAKWIRETYPDIGVIIYSGRCFSHLHIEIPRRRGFLARKC